MLKLSHLKKENKDMILSFFSYKDNIDYHGQDMFGTFHIIYLFLAILSIILLVYFLRKVSHDKITKYLKILAIIMPFWELIKIIWETSYYYPIHHDFEWSGLLPLYLCSMFIYVLPFAGYGRGKIKQASLGFLCTLGILGGLVNFVMPPILNSYPFFSYASFVSLIYHYLMVFTGIWLWVSGYYQVKKGDELLSFVPVLLFSLIVIPVNYILKSLGYYPDYMLYMSGNGAPLLPKISSFLSERGLRFIYTLMVMLFYLLFDVIFIYLARLIKKVKIKTKA